MVRRLIVIAAAAVAVLGLAAPAHAAEASVTSPEDGATLDGSQPVDIDVRITGGPVSGVAVRIVHKGGTTSSAALRCVQTCGSSRQLWRVRFDPDTGEPFADHQLHNGPARIDVAVDGGGFKAGSDLRLSLPAEPPSNLTTSTDGDDVTVRWEHAPQPDTSAYRIQRRTADGPWQQVGEVSGATTRFVDADRDAGGYGYRVVSVRPDGRGGTFTAASNPTATVVAPDPVSTEPTPPSPDMPEDDPDPSGGGDGDSDGGGDSGDGGSSDEGSSNGSGDAGGSDSRRASSGGLALAQGSAPSDGSASRDGAPSPPSPDVAGAEEFYGEDGEFSHELDFVAEPGAREARTPDPISESEMVRIPGATTTSLSRMIDPERVATPLAGGLLLIATGLHLRQWLARGSSYLRPR